MEDLIKSVAYSIATGILSISNSGASLSQKTWVYSVFILSDRGLCVSAKRIRILFKGYLKISSGEHRTWRAFACFTSVVAAFAGSAPSQASDFAAMGTLAQITLLKGCSKAFFNVCALGKSSCFFNQKA